MHALISTNKLTHRSTHAHKVQHTKPHASFKAVLPRTHMHASLKAVWLGPCARDKPGRHMPYQITMEVQLELARVTGGAAE